jgi:hypothetical protein
MRHLIFASFHTVLLYAARYVYGFYLGVVTLGTGAAVSLLRPGGTGSPETDM